MAGEKELYLRHELKYPIDMLQYQVLQKKMDTLLKPDPYMGAKKQYNIRNLYFDDFWESAYHQKEAGVPNRKKYRIRIYNHSDAVIKFERKTKISHHILKESTRISRADAEQIISGNYNFLAHTQNNLLKAFLMEHRCKSMRPAVVVEYDREAYVHPVGKVRITFDTGLRTSLGAVSFFDSELCTMTIQSAPSIILEIKYNEVLAQFICGLFPDTIRPRLAIGKFSHCRNQQKCQTGSVACKLSCSE